MKIKHTRTLKHRVLFALMCIMILQCIVFSCCILLTGTTQALDESACSVFDNSVKTNAKQLEEKLVGWSQLDKYEESITQIVEKLASKNNKKVSEYVKSNSAKKQILNASFEKVLRYLRNLNSTGCYIILGDEKADTLKDALVLRDLDPENDSEKNYDILVEAGSSELMFNQGLTLDSYWTEKLNITEDSDFYFKPFNAGNEYQKIDANDLGYYSVSHRLHKNDIEVITYTIPLLDENHNSYGVIGIEITISYLQKLIENMGVGIETGNNYYIGMTKDGTNYQSVLIADGRYQSSLQVLGDLKLKKNGSFYLVEGTNPNLEMSLYHCKLYSTNTPFENEQWVIAGFVEKSALTVSSEQLMLKLKISIVTSLIISIIGALYLSTSINRPIKILLAGIESGSKNEVKLPRTEIKEIDNLSLEIERRTREVYESGSKMADIISVADIDLGIIEFADHSPEIYCTEKILTMFDIKVLNWHDNYAPRQGNKYLVEAIFNNLTLEKKEKNIYRYKRNRNNYWVSVKKIISDERQLYIFLDVTATIREKIKIAHDRDYDVLTNLYNRRAFARDVQEVLNTCNNLVLAIWDLDHLKYINDSYGHDIGDKYICQLADILASIKDKNYICARMAGDEFMTCFYNDELENLYQKMRDLHQVMVSERVFLPDGKELPLSVSVGMSAFKVDSLKYQQLLEYADFAMYQVKKSEKGKIGKFNKEEYLKNYLMVHGVGELNRIIEERAVKYAFQPIVDVKTKRTFAYEALMRPQSEALRSPADVLELAENYSRLGDIERISYFCALKQFFCKEQDEDIKIFINSIPNQCLDDEEFIYLEQTYGKKLENVVVEVIENTKADEEKENKKHNWCKDHHIALALDDFGSGYSNTDMLILQKFAYVKLDMELVRSIHGSLSARSLIASVIEYCHKNQRKVIAEGIETKKELEAVMALGVDYVQGYYFGKPSLDELPVDFTEKF